MVDKRIGARIKQYRELRGMTQEQLAERINVSVGYLSCIERGVNFPRVENLISILNTLNISANEVFIDVLDKADEIKASELSGRISALPPDRRRLLLTVIEAMLSDAEGE